MSDHLIIGDLHAAEQPPGRRDLNYFDDCMAKLDQIVDLAARHDDTIFIGDLFHSKRANHVSHRLVLALSDRIREMGDVYVLPGNHDLADGSLESLARQPLSTLALLPNVTLLDGPMGTVYEISGDTFLGVPGIGSVCDAKPEALDWFCAPDLHVQIDAVLAHAPICVEDKPWPTWHPNDLPLPESCRALVYGHQHDKARLVIEGSYDAERQYPMVLATGAVMRGAISEAENEPAVVALELGEHVGGSILPLQARPASEVYRWAEREAERAENAALDAFVESIGTTRIAGFSVEDLISSIRSNEEIPGTVRSAAIEIVEGL